jgi:lipopolysaccharide/colanic/teichoic acid biosynthesis glycosyltransferase
LRLLLPLLLGPAYLTAIYLRFYSGWIPVSDHPVWPAYIAYFVVSAGLWSVLEARYSLIDRLLGAKSILHAFALVARTDLVALALASALAFFWRDYSFSRLTVAFFWTTHFGLAAAAIFAIRTRLSAVAKKERHYVILTGDEVSAHRVREELIGRGAQAEIQQVGNGPAAIKALSAESTRFDGPVLVVLAPAEAKWTRALAEAGQRLPVDASIAMQVEDTFVWLTPGSPVEGSFDYLVIKRVLDFVIAAAGLTVLLPLLAATALVILVRSGRPVIISQQRVGRGGRQFRLFKFRTLPAAALRESDSRWSAPATDAWGRLLRATGFDEIPQLWNVLRGEMSLVGPRPERPLFVDQFRRELPYYPTRHKLHAGITGWAQVHGYRGDTSIAQRLDHDLFYLRNWSLGLDFRILAMTLVNLPRELRRGRAAQRRAHAGSA